MSDTDQAAPSVLAIQPVQPQQPTSQIPVVPSQSARQVQQPVSQPAAATPQPTDTVSQPTAGGIKEHEPIGAGPAEVSAVDLDEQEVVKQEAQLSSSIPEAIIPKELKEIGVEEVKEAIKLDEEVKAAGVDHAKEGIPTVTDSTNSITLPMTLPEAIAAKKSHGFFDSISWLAAKTIYLYKWKKFNIKK